MRSYLFFVTLLNHLYWVSGATIGGLAGSLVTFDTTGLSFVMIALFVVIFMEQWAKERHHWTALVGAAASVACLLAFGPDRFMLPAMACMIVVLTAMRRPLEERRLLQ